MTDEELLTEAKQRFEHSATTERENRDAFVDDLAFYGGDQWPESVKRDRELQQRPCLMVNRMPQFVRQVTNDQRQNRPAVKVRPVDDNADVETAEILSGLVRHIESNSAADIAYDTAFFYSVAGGFGYYRVTTDYCNDKSFEQEIFIKQIPNPLTVYPDPDGRAPDGSDWKYCFITEEMPREQFKKLYPEEEGGWGEGHGDTKGWVTEDTVRMAEYFYEVIEKKKLYRLEDGSVVTEKEKPAGAIVVDERDAEFKSIKWTKLGGNSVLEKRDWAGKYIPIIPVYGDAVEIDGKRKLFSLMRFAKDPQRMLNYYRSTETELMALQPKAPWVMAEGQDEGYEDMWDRANQENFSSLIYKPTTFGDALLPPPQRVQFATPPTGVMQGAINAEQDLKATTGIHEAGLGEKSNETSGRAILARAKESDNATFHFIDNMTRSIRQCGRILVDLIPKVYDTPRVVRILGEDGSEQMKRVNEMTQDKDKNGNPIERIYDMTVGQYDVAVAAGPSYTTKRQESAESMMQMVQANPEMMSVAGDLIVKSMDWPGAEDLAERLKKTLPPGLQDKDDDAPQLPPEVQQQMQEKDQMIQQLDQTVQAMSKELESKDIERERLELDRMKVQGELQIKAQAAKPGVVQPDTSMPEADKLRFDAELKIALKQMDIDAARELEMMRMGAKQQEAGEQQTQEDDVDTQVVLEAIGALSQQMQHLGAILSAPKELIRDPQTGKPIGSRIVMTNEPEQQ
jgi:hypothetical protein